MNEHILINIIKALVSEIDKTKFTVSHSESVSELSKRLAEAFNYSSEKITEIQLGALLHDIGFLRISDSIFNKRRELLKEEEISLIKNHPNLGKDIIKNFESLNFLIQYIEDHQENIDGTGYPNGKSQISREVQIVAICDVYDGLTSNRSYVDRKPFTKEEALNFIETLIDIRWKREVFEKFKIALQE